MRCLWVALMAAALATAATACDVCSGLSLHEEPVTEILLPSTGDLSSCACAFVFSYSAGATPGKVTLSATPGVGSVTVYGDAVGTELIAELPEAAVVEGVVVHSRTGVIRVDLATTASPPPSAFIALSSTAVNTAPIITEREGLVRDPLGTIVTPWSTEGDLLPVTIRDYDNFDRGLRAELQFEAESLISPPSLALSVPQLPGVVFEEGAANGLSRRVVVSGPGSAVEATINNAQMVPIGLVDNELDGFAIYVSDFGNSGEGKSLAAEYTAFVGVFPAGVVDVPRGESLLNSGVSFRLGGIEAVFLVHDAYRVDFVEMDLPPAVDGVCTDFLRVWDGSDLATARLLSTDLFSTGEICGNNDGFQPSYESTTGEFVVEYLALTSESVSFDTEVSTTPDGFRAWMVDDSPLQVVVDAEPLLLPQIMVTSLPDPGEIAVNITATAALSLRFADSFGDLVQVSDSRLLSLEVVEEEGAPAMLRMGDALREVQLAADALGTVVVRVDAWSGGVAAVALEVEVEAVAVAINAPATLSVNAFQPVPLAVSVDVAGSVSGAGAGARRLGHIGDGRGLGCFEPHQRTERTLANERMDAQRSGEDAGRVQRHLGMHGGGGDMRRVAGGERHARMCGSQSVCAATRRWRRRRGAARLDLRRWMRCGLERECRGASGPREGPGGGVGGWAGPAIHPRPAGVEERREPIPREGGSHEM